MKGQKILLALAAAVLVIGGIVSSGVFGLNWHAFDRFFPKSSVQKTETQLPSGEKVKITTEESVVIDVVDKSSPAVVTVGISKTNRSSSDSFQFNPFDPFSPFRQVPGTPRKVEQDIGSGFVVDAGGLIVTNKHVVSEPDAKYRIITKDNKTFDVVKIYRDPENDLAIVKIAAAGLPTVNLGDSDKIKVGQLAIAIGTALGEFRNTVTTGVVSGIGRGITAGSSSIGDQERLENVIQTDAAINPGNSGGPLLNSSGEVIGVNTAISAEGQNIGFAIPINVVKDAIQTFNETGQFNRPFLGIQYEPVSRQVAILNEVPEGAYVRDVIPGSPAEAAGLKADDIITKIDQTRLSGDDNNLAKIISHKHVGDTVTVVVWRDGKELTLTATLKSQEQ